MESDVNIQKKQTVQDKYLKVVLKHLTQIQKNFQMTVKNSQQVVKLLQHWRKAVSEAPPLSQESDHHESDNKATPFYFGCYLEHIDM